MTSTDLPSPSTPVVVRFGALGDMILTTPLLRALAARHGHPCAVACMGEWTRALYANLPFVGPIQTIASRGMPYWLSPAQGRLVRFLSRYRGHPVYLLEGDDRSHALIERSGVSVTASLRSLATHDNLHQVEVHARVAGFQAQGVYTDGFDPTPLIQVTEAERADCRRWLMTLIPADAPVVLVHPGNKKTASWRKRSNNLKEWPPDRWIAVMRGVLRRLPAARILITGSRQERLMTERLARDCGDPRVLAIAGETSLRRLFAVLSLAHSLVSVDTGPAHAAGALECPVAVLFGQTDPRANRPLSRSGRVQVITGPAGAPELPGEAAWRAHHRMDAIDVEAVLAAWETVSQR